MTQTPPSDPMGMPSAPVSSTGQAVTAFLRGIERRGALFAELQGGDPVVADLAYAQALRVFRDSAASHAFAYWPRLFWRALLAAPPLRAGSADAQWPPPFTVLGACGSGPRAALLLRLAAGLTDADAASVLGIAAPTYRLALQQALPRSADGSADPGAWRALDAAMQEALRMLPAERLAHLARLRQAAAQGRRPDLIGPLPVQPAEPPPDARPAPVVRGALWAGVALCALGLVGTFVWPWPWPITEGSDPQVRTRPLPPAQRPAARFDRATALLTEPDFELLAQADADAMPEDPGFLAWLAAERARVESGDAGIKTGIAGMRDPMPPQTDALASQPESVDAPF